MLPNDWYELSQIVEDHATEYSIEVNRYLRLDSLEFQNGYNQLPVGSNS